MILATQTKNHKATGSSNAQNLRQQQKHKLLQKTQVDHKKKSMSVAEFQKQSELLTRSLAETVFALTTQPNNVALQKIRSQKQNDLNLLTESNRLLVSQADRAAKLMEQRKSQALKAAEAKNNAEATYNKELATHKILLETKHKQITKVDSLKKRQNDLYMVIPLLQKSLPSHVKQRDAEKKIVEQLTHKAKHCALSEQHANRVKLALLQAQQNELRVKK